MTVQNKIYEGLAMGKPVVSGDSPAVRQALEHGKHIYLCDRNDPASLAGAVRLLKDDSALRKALAENGQHVFRTHYSLDRIGCIFASHLSDLLEKQAGTKTS
jgi:glycosyltransferase involved in cell wall biosynthesis